MFDVQFWWSVSAVGPLLLLMVWRGLKWLCLWPHEDRRWLDRPPFLLRLVWPAVLLLVLLLHPLFRRIANRNLASRLAQAGLDYCLTPDQFRASQWLCAVLVALLAGLSGVFAFPGMDATLWTTVIFFAGWWFPRLWLRETRQRREQRMLRELPFILDVITLSVEAGSNLTGGLRQVVEKTPSGPLRDECNRVLREIHSGRTRAESLRSLAVRAGIPLVRLAVGSMIQAEQSGSNLGPLLRIHADQARKQRFQHAEKCALEAPVKLLLPLVLFIFPTTFLLIGFVLLGKAIQSGVIDYPPLVQAFYWPG